MCIKYIMLYINSWTSSYGSLQTCQIQERGALGGKYFSIAVREHLKGLFDGTISRGVRNKLRHCLSGVTIQIVFSTPILSFGIA